MGVHRWRREHRGRSPKEAKKMAHKVRREWKLEYGIGLARWLVAEGQRPL